MIKRYTLFALIIYIFLFILANPALGETISIPITEIAHVQENDSDGVFWGNPNLYVGFVTPECGPFSPWDTAPYTCDRFRTRTFVTVNRDLIADIDPTSITDASLYLYLHDMQLWTSFVLDAYRLDEDWSPATLYWLNQPHWDNKILTAYLQPELGWKKLNITPWVQNIIAGNYPAHGLVLVPRQVTHEACVFFSPFCAEAENNTCPNNQTPFLLIKTDESEPTSVTSLRSPQDNVIVCNPQVTFSWTKSSDSDISVIRISNESRELIYEQSAESTEYTQNLPDGHYSWNILGSDHSRQFTIDTTTPEPPVIQDEQNSSTLTWSTPEENLLYLAECSPDPDFKEVTVSSPWIKKPQFASTDLLSDTTYHCRVMAKDSCGNMSDFSKTLTIKHNNTPSQNNTEEITLPTQPISSDGNDIQKISPPKDEVLGESSTPQKESTPSPDNTSSSTREPTLATPTCVVYLFEPDKTYRIESCTFPRPIINSIKHTRTISGGSELIVYGYINKEINLVVHRYVCAPRSLFSPSTWFNCKRTYVKTTRHTLHPIITATAEVTTGSQVRSEFEHDSTGKFHLSVRSSQNLSFKILTLILEQRAFKKITGTWIDIRGSSQSLPRRIPEAKLPISPSRPFAFVFDRIIGVTQWHGYTAFQHPHKGIDFGAHTEEIFAPADGVIDSIGWDNYGSNCNSGGNILRIKHSNGKYTAYFHLKNYKKTNGTPWKPGEKISRGERIGLSGNTGAWNCQSLGYHLHYEIRASRSQSTHTDPVPLTDIDWKSVPTLGWRTYPGRLTGDNPHPTY